MGRLVLAAMGACVMGLAAVAAGQGAGEAGGAAQDWSMAKRFMPDRIEAQLANEARLIDAVDPERLGAFHELLSQEPHLAGSPGDHRNIERIADAMRGFGLDVEVQWIEVLLARPIDAALQIIEPTRKDLNVHEPPVDGDAFMAQHEITMGWNGYSGSGDVTGGVVYANRGTKEDFEMLDELGISVKDKVVIARYGGNYRGYKAKFAEERGAAGLVMYSDPRDVGYMRGMGYPDGTWANENHIQRGTISTVPYEGDPLTPGVAALADADIDRLDMHEVGLPTIPVQPVGWGAAREILSRMEGDPVPSESWQGGLPFVYRVTGGEKLKVRLKVEQEWKLMRTANVVGTLAGEMYPDEMIVLGCHHDSWGHGASDPNAGMMVLLECARVFGEMARGNEEEGIEPELPRRTLKFAAWGAEEFGIIGSTEWCEAHRYQLANGAVAYLNLDMAAMGPDFRASSDPLLTQVIFDAARQVPHCYEEDATVYDSWVARAGRRATEPNVGTLGGGSDHVAFYCHLGIPSAAFGAGGARGTAYHSNFDTITWYRKAVGDDYLPAQMVTRVTAIVASRLAEADVVPLDPVRIGQEIKQHFSMAMSMLEEYAPDIAEIDLGGIASRFTENGTEVEALIEELLAESDRGEQAREKVSELLRRYCRVWVRTPGEGDLEWFRNGYAISDPYSGYGSWGVPRLRFAIEHTIEQNERHLGRVDAAMGWYTESARQLMQMTQSFERRARNFIPKREDEPLIGE